MWHRRWYLIDQESLTELQLTNNTERFAGLLRSSAGECCKRYTALNRKFLWWRLGALLVSHLVLCIGAYQLIAAASSGSLLPGQLTFLIGGMVTFGGTLSRAAINVRELCKDGHLVSEFFEVLDLADSRNRATGVAPEKSECPTIEFSNVGFTYPSSSETEKKVEPSLTGINLRFEPGKKYAIVGPSGAGKSTLVSPLCGLHEPSTGKVMVDGSDLGEIDEFDWRNTIGVLIQKFGDFNPLTLAEMVSLGSHESAEQIGDVRLMEAVRRARAEDIVARKPNGLRQLNGKGFKDGTGLSLGQVQRIRIAGVHAGDRPVLVLDEPTAHQDPGNHHALMADFFRKDGKTLVLITHHLSNCIDADEVIVLQNGTIAERGSHHELIGKPGWYAENFAIQAERYR
jgi:ABC-type multidrug transport system fused ATPase/permease subunit